MVFLNFQSFELHLTSVCAAAYHSNVRPICWKGSVEKNLHSSVVATFIPPMFELFDVNCI